MDKDDAVRGMAGVRFRFDSIDDLFAQGMVPTSVTQRIIIIENLK